MDRLELFQEELRKRLTKELGEEVLIIFESKICNNGCRELAMTVSNDGYNYAVKFSIEDIYDSYCKNPSALEHIVIQMIQELQNRKRITWTAEKLGEYESVKEKIYMKLVNAKANREFLASIPHIPYLDLAVTFYLQMNTSQSCSMSLRISERELAKWGKSVEDIYADAFQNMIKESDPPQPMEKYFKEMQEDFENGDPDLYDYLLNEYFVMEKEESMLYVLTNRKGFLGACRMLDTCALQKLAKLLEKNLYLIPSSLHEILIMPEGEYQSPEQIAEMVMMVNQNELSPKDRLSNSVYLFDRNTLSTRIVWQGEPM